MTIHDSQIASPALVPSQVKKSTKLLYGFGTAAYGVKDGGFNTLLMLFYNQALGLPAQWVGLAIMIALIVDGFVDPLIGQASDRLRSQFGRRHPFMYGAAIPCAFLYYGLWNPPTGLDHLALFLYLLGSAIAVRIAIAFYEIPSASLMAELTDDYTERTSIVALRFFFGWAGGIIMGILAFTVFLVNPPPGSADMTPGILNLAGYHSYSIVAALVMMGAILISSLGTHSAIPHLRAPPPLRPLSISRDVKEALEALSNKPFLLTLMTGLFAGAASGIAGTLAVYFGTYFWGLPTDQFSLLLLTTFFSAGGAIILSGFLTKAVEKKKGALIASLGALVVAPLPIILRLFDVMPANGSSALLGILSLHMFASTLLSVTASILITSMMVDTVEVNEVKTKTRTEGLYFAASFFVQKCVSGIGIFVAGLIIALVKFPVNAKANEVDPAILTQLALVYLALMLLLNGTAIYFISLYSLNKKDHEANLNIIRNA